MNDVIAELGENQRLQTPIFNALIAGRKGTIWSCDWERIVVCSLRGEEGRRVARRVDVRVDPDALTVFEVPKSMRTGKLAGLGIADGPAMAGVELRRRSDVRARESQRQWKCCDCRKGADEVPVYPYRQSRCIHCTQKMKCKRDAERRAASVAKAAS